MTYDPQFMHRAIALSEQALAIPGAAPYGAVVVKDGRIIGEGLNHAICNHDPSSHGEVEAIRAACRALEAVDLSGCDLYASCEPCALCVSLMTITNIAQLYYAAGTEDACALLTDWPDSLPYSLGIMHEAGVRVGSGRLPAAQHMSRAALAVIDRWMLAKGQA
jgi:tRNA(Arg) A34 adenosine deaminase TadA